MISRMINALARAILVALLVALPSLALPGIGMDGAQIALFTAILAGIFTFVEYHSSAPAMLEFRDAAPFNRMRFIMVLVIVSLLTALSYGQVDQTNLTALVQLGASSIGGFWDVPLSPVRVLVMALPESADLTLVFAVRDGAALSFTVALLAVALFYALIRVFDWPTRHGPFNVWINLPLFDPTTGGDVVFRLRRDGHVNIVIGVALPFALPALVIATGEAFDVLSILESQSFVWSLTAWSFVPASMIMRGLAICRVADLIDAKRQRVYAEAATSL